MMAQHDMGLPARSRLFWERWSLFWTFFVGLGAVLGTAMMWLAPDAFGMTPLLEFMQCLPMADIFFTSMVWPGVFLLVVNGLTQLVAARLVLRRHRYAPVAVMACGVILMGWIIIQFIIFPPNPLSIAYFVFGLTETVMATIWFSRHSRSPAVKK